MCKSVLPSPMCTAQGGQKKEVEPLELELQMVVSHMGAGNYTLVLWKNSQCL